jgi:hypothetical protein
MEMNKLTKTEVRVLLLALVLHQERLTTYLKASRDENFIENCTLDIETLSEIQRKMLDLKLRQQETKEVDMSTLLMWACCGLIACMLVIAFILYII